MRCCCEHSIQKLVFVEYFLNYKSKLNSEPYLRGETLTDLASNREGLRDGRNCDGPRGSTAAVLTAVLAVRGAVLELYYPPVIFYAETSVGRYCVETQTQISPSEDEGRDATVYDQSAVKLTETEQFYCLSRKIGDMTCKENVKQSYYILSLSLSALLFPLFLVSTLSGT